MLRTDFSFYTQMWGLCCVDAHIFSAIVTICSMSENCAKFRKWNHACLMWGLCIVDAHIFSAVVHVGKQCKVQKVKPCLPNQIHIYSDGWFKCRVWKFCFILSMLIGWKFTPFPCFLHRFGITTDLAKGCQHACAQPWNLTNVIKANVKWISSSTGEILAILQRAPLLPILHRIELVMPGFLIYPLSVESFHQQQQWKLHMF